MLNFIKVLPVVVCGLLLHTNAQATEVLIDDFSTGQDQIRVTNFDEEANSQASGGGIIGGYRDIYITEIEPEPSNPGDPTPINSDQNGISAGVDPATERLSISLDPEVQGYAAVTYDGENEVGNNWDSEAGDILAPGSGVDIDGLGGEDWSGITGFLFEDVYNDAVAPAQLIVWTDDLNNGVYVKHIADIFTLGISDPNSVDYFDSFISTGEFSDAGNINWANVGAFQAIFNLNSMGMGGVVSVDISLSRATAQIPEPAALSMFGAGLLILSFVGNRRRKNQ